MPIVSPWESRLTSAENLAVRRSLVARRQNAARTDDLLRRARRLIGQCRAQASGGIGHHGIETKL
ncbi:hypothetical protein PHO31112_04802 [Pandoraea horticolens]|uniref:Uncharacterized protein n=1 Tax=Pandoraea horticolens TaxID=2508298 RepID=A0A5E4YW57_9BURK|nr:hypothetical protein PHO31112_04802 [Pandoraea horticolens]